MLCATSEDHTWVLLDWLLLRVFPTTSGLPSVLKVLRCPCSSGFRKLKFLRIGLISSLLDFFVLKYLMGLSGYLTYTPISELASMSNMFLGNEPLCRSLELWVLKLRRLCSSFCASWREVIDWLDPSNLFSFDWFLRFVWRSGEVENNDFFFRKPMRLLLISLISLC